MNTSVTSEAKAYLVQLGHFFSHNAEKLNYDLTTGAASKALAELAELPIDDVVQTAKRLLGFSVSSAAIAASAFYFGYQYANKKKSRFDNNTQNYQVTSPFFLLHNEQEILILKYLLKKIEQILCKLKLSKVQLNKVMSLMISEMEKGLQSATHANADVKMFPTYVRALPDGTERGDILALDLGGTNFRVLLINLDSGEIKVRSKVFVIPQSIMIGSGTQLFDHIAICLSNFMKSEQLIGRPELPLGFTFSFPCKQQGLASATLSTWTKGFDCDGVVGKDVVKLLQEAINKHVT